MNQAIDNRTSGTVWSRKALLGACLMVVATLLAASLMMAAQPAHAATPLTVNSTADFHDTITNDGFCGFGGSCSLRAAIEEANSNTTLDVINFDIPGTGVKTIVVNSTGLGALPPIKGQVTINGYTQTGASPNTSAVGDNAALKIQLDGTNVGGNGLEISNASGSVIKGLVINRFGLSGIFVNGDSVGNRIEGNFIGTNPTGTIDRGNGQDAVTIFAGPSETVIGGTTLAARNLLSGNGNRGVLILDSNASRIQGNYVGTDKSGTKDLGNAHAGVLIGGSDNLVGNGTSAGSNTIAFNGGDGITVSGSTVIGNTISRYSIFSNAGLGIDLVGGVEDAAGRTANDLDDPDQGPNALQNKPVLSSAKTVSGKTTIKGKFNSGHAGFDYLIQFYSNPSGTNEGKKFIGQKIVTTDEIRNATFTFSPATAVSAGQTITASAAESPSHVGTSEFSAPKTVASS